MASRIPTKVPQSKSSRARPDARAEVLQALKPKRATALRKDELSTGAGKRLRVGALKGDAVALSATRVGGANRIDGRTTGDALYDMDRVLKGDRTEEPTDWGSKVVRNPPDANSKDDWDYRTPRYQDAKAQIDANGALEAQALKRMTPAQREAYASVRTALVESGDMISVLALQRLLFTGQLPGAKDLEGRMTTLDRLAAISSGKAPLAEGVNRGTFLTNLVQELATPSCINQGSKGTCGPTAVLVELAMKNPSEYVRIAMDLASPRGEVTLASGLVVRREPGTEHDDGSGRTSVQQIVGAALMEATNPTEYDPATDTGAGATALNLSHLHDAIFGPGTTPTPAVSSPAEGAAVLKRAIAALARGVPTPLMIQLGAGEDSVNHWVLLVGHETRDGVDYVRYINPWGREEVMRADEFQKRLTGSVDR